MRKCFLCWVIPFKFEIRTVAVLLKYSDFPASQYPTVTKVRAPQDNLKARNRAAAARPFGRLGRGHHPARPPSLRIRPSPWNPASRPGPGGDSAKRRRPSWLPVQCRTVRPEARRGTGLIYCLLIYYLPIYYLLILLLYYLPGMPVSCPSWQWHRTGYSWSPVRTLPEAPLW